MSSSGNNETPEEKNAKLELAGRFLLAEHSLFKEFFVRDLEIAERRVDFFTKVSGGVIAFIGTLLGLATTGVIGSFIDYPRLLIVGSFLAAVLLVIGYGILVRIAYRNISIEKWKKRMAMITDEFRVIYPRLNEKYYPFNVQKPGYGIPEQKWNTGRLHVIMMRINSIVSVMFVELILESVRSNANIIAMEWLIWPLTFGVVSYLIAASLQKKDIDRRTKKWKCDVLTYIAVLEDKTSPDCTKLSQKKESKEEA